MLRRTLPLVVVMLLAAAVPAVSAEDSVPKSQPSGSLKDLLALPADNIRDALDSEYRSADDRLRDGPEKTEAILRASGIARGMRIVDLSAGDGYFAQVLALAVRRFGKVWGNNDPASIDPATAEAWKKRLHGAGGADVAELALPLGSPLPPYVTGIDIVFARGTSHDAARRSIDRTAVHRSVLAALSPRGRYVVVDARASGEDARSAALCRADVKTVRKEIEDAGFRLVSESDALRNRSDSTSKSACADAAADRFLLVFEKPAA